jgi:poly-gamma-glutamate synthesis protein (capsule biosynthesis protein)
MSRSFSLLRAGSTAALVLLLGLPDLARGGDLSSGDGPVPEATLLFTGDVLPHSPVVNSAARNTGGQGHDFSPMFGEVAPAVSAVDWAVCHLEVNLGVPGVVSSSFPRLAAPASIADGIAGAGFDACSTASNHSLDFGEVGVVSTIAALDQAGLAHTGTATGPAEVNGALYVLDDLVIGHASYSYWFNGLNPPADQPWLANRIDLERILDDGARLRRVGADFVVITLHWGVEYIVEPRQTEIELAGRLMDSPDIDLIIGHHAHVIQPLDWIGEELVAFGLGNFLSNQSRLLSQDGVMLLVRLESHGGAWTTTEIVAVPTWVDRRNGHVMRSALSQSALWPSADRTADALVLSGALVPLLSVGEARRWSRGPDLEARLESLCGLGAC